VLGLSLPRQVGTLAKILAGPPPSDEFAEADPYKASDGFGQVANAAGHAEARTLPRCPTPVGAEGAGC
jgi:hypothetical protein